mmetsp:Transcript_7681/g.15480  ORF Transcript_7681/g.15480 Transcript_7681/m.15480 type:complete len:512 (-) Transcript_7681:650-2185(-)
MTRRGTTARSSRGRRRRYGQVPSSGSLVGDDGDDVGGDVAVATTTSDGGIGRPSPTSAELPRHQQEEHQHQQQQQKEKMVITVLDTAHSKFSVPADPNWTVARFKSAGASRHGVSASSQRLIYMGRLLDDMMTLEECGLDGGEGDGEDGGSSRIVHLFPKPNVVLRGDDDDLGNVLVDGGGNGGESGGASSTAASASGGGASASGGGAHVPQIFLDVNEASSPVLVLSSQEIFESMHRVKLLSFLLLIMSSMELLTLFSIMMGGSPDTDGGSGGASSGYGGRGYDDIPPGDPTDTGPPAYGGGGGGAGQQVAMRTWRTSDWADLVVSVLGLYVATLGVKATTESTVFMAKKYFYGLILAGLSWNAYQYYLNVVVYDEAEEAAEQAAEDAEDGGGGGGLGPNQAPDYGSPYTAALGTLMIPMGVWLMCWFRAWEFQRLMVQAEQEAEERTRMLTGGGRDRDHGEGDEEEDESGGDHVDDDEEQGRGGTGTAAAGSGEDDLEFSVQVEGRTIT